VIWRFREWLMIGPMRPSVRPVLLTTLGLVVAAITLTAQRQAAQREDDGERDADDRAGAV
jgi:hypothetical protein